MKTVAGLILVSLVSTSIQVQTAQPSPQATGNALTRSLNGAPPATAPATVNQGPVPSSPARPAAATTPVSPVTTAAPGVAGPPATTVPRGNPASPASAVVPTAPVNAIPAVTARPTTSATTASRGPAPTPIPPTASSRSEPAPATASPVPAPPTVLNPAAVAALPFSITLPTGFQITTGRPGPDFNVYTIRRGNQPFVMVYAGPSSQFPIYSGDIVEAAGRASVVTVEGVQRRAVEHLFQRATRPSEVHVWVSSLEGADRLMAEQIAQSVDVR